MNLCPSDATMSNLENRDNQCLSFCGARIRHGYADVNAICKCKTREIFPCSEVEDEAEKEECNFKYGYQYFAQECDIGSEDAIGAGAVQKNDYKLQFCDHMYPYNNDLYLNETTPFRGILNKSWSKRNGGYLKFDILTDDIAHIGMNTRQGDDKIAKMGIMYTAQVDSAFKPQSKLNDDHVEVSFIEREKEVYKNIFNSKLSPNNNLYRDVNTNVKENSKLYVASKRMDFQDVLVKKQVYKDDPPFSLAFSFFANSYGSMDVYDPDFEKGRYVYQVYGLGPISKPEFDEKRIFYSLNWTGTYRCNQGFGTQQAFGINGSHWPVMYVSRYDKRTNRFVTAMIFFDHLRKCEWDLRRLQDYGYFTVRTREPEFRFFVSIGKSTLDVRKHYMQITGSPSPPVKKTMGLWISRFGYKNFEEMEEDMNLLREKQFPLDGFVFDLYWYGHAFPNFTDIELSEQQYTNNFCYRKYSMINREKMGLFFWDRVNFPNPEKYLNDLYAKYNYGATLIQEPYFNADSRDFSYCFYNNMVARLENGTWAQPEGVMRNWVGTHAAMPDYSNPETGRYWYESRIKRLVTDATFGWWNDLSEPEVYNQNAFYLGSGQIQKDGTMSHELRQSVDVLNMNQLYWIKETAKAYEKGENKRYSVLCRAGTCGIQRYGFSMWPGDEESFLEEMLSSQEGAQTLSLCGIDFVSSDAGGFVSGFQNEERLYSVWYANAAASRYNLKPHKWINDSMKYQTSSPAVWGNVEANLRNTVERYLLSPFYYSTAMDISNVGSRKGQPWITTLFFYTTWIAGEDNYTGTTGIQADPGYVDIELGLTGGPKSATNANRQVIGNSILYILYTTDKDNYKEKVALPHGMKVFDWRNKTWYIGNKAQDFEVEPLMNVDNPSLPMYFIDKKIIPMRGYDKKTVDWRFNDVLDYYKIFIVSYDGLSAETFTLFHDDGISTNKKIIKYYIGFDNGEVLLRKNTKSSKTPVFEFFLINKDSISKIENVNMSVEGYEPGTVGTVGTVKEDFNESETEQTAVWFLAILLAAFAILGYGTISIFGSLFLFLYSVVVKDYYLAAASVVILVLTLI